MTTFTLVDNPPQPASGDGDVVVSLDGGAQVVLTWQHGHIVDISPADDELGAMADITLKSESGGSTSAAPVCWKCLLNEDGALVTCWLVPC